MRSVVIRIPSKLLKKLDRDRQILSFRRSRSVGRDEMVRIALELYLEDLESQAVQKGEPVVRLPGGPTINVPKEIEDELAALRFCSSCHRQIATVEEVCFNCVCVDCHRLRGK